MYSVVPTHGNITNAQSRLQLYYSRQFSRALKLKSESTAVQIVDVTSSSDTESITSDRDQKTQITDVEYLLEFCSQLLFRK